MKLVIDTNIIISALIRDSVTRQILVSDEFEFMIPEFSFQEIDAHKQEILDKSGMFNENFELLFAALKENLTIVPESEIYNQEEAKVIMDLIDPDDTLFIALALSTNNEGIWSDDRHFEKQNKIRVWKTKDLYSLL